MSIKIADGYVEVGLEDRTDRDLDKILAKLRAAGKQRGIPVGVEDETARPLREIDAKLKAWTATHSQQVKVTADTGGIERASLKAAGAVREHNAEVLRLRKEMPELGKASEGAFKLMTSGTRSFGNGLDAATSSLSELSGMGRAMPGLIIAGLELLPTVAAAAGGAITLGLGGAFTAVGIIAASKNKEIRQEYSSLGKEIFGHLQADAAPFVGVLEHVGMYAEDEFRSWQPLIKNAFASTAPAVDRFAHQAIASLDQFKPAFTSIMDGFRVQLKGLGPELPSITHNIAAGIQAIGDAAQKNPQALGEMAHDLSLIVRIGGEAIGFLTRWEGWINRGIEDVNAFAVGPLGSLALGLYKVKNLASAGIFGKTSEAFVNFGNAANGAAGAATETGLATEHLKTAQQLAAMSSDELKSALDRLTNVNQSAFDSQTAYAEALNAANEQAKKSNAGLDGNSQAIQNNRRALSDLAQATKANIENGHLSAKQIEQERQAFIRAAEGMGASKSRAKELADELLGVSGAMKKVPDRKSTKLTATDNTKPAVSSAKKNTSSFTDKIWRAQLTAQDKVGGAVSAAAGAARRFAGGLYRGNLTALNKTGSVVSSAISGAKRFAGGTYRASLIAVNGAVSAFNSAMSLGRTWASKVFTATFNVLKKINPFATGGYVGAYADGGLVDGPVQHYPDGGLISGPGTETSDSIPIMTSQGMIRGSDGEYMVNAKQTKRYKPLLDMINYGLAGFAGGGQVGIGYASGGKVTKAKRASAGSSLVSSIESHLLSSLSSIKDVASKVNDAIKKYFSGKTESRMLAWAKNIEGQWESAASKLATLNDKIKEAKDYAATAKSTVLGTADLSNLGTIGSASDITSGLGFKLQQMQAFSAKIKKLQGLGLNKSVLTQIINAGPVQGGAIADMLLKDTSQIKAINTEEGQLDKIAGDIGNTAADVMYDSGKNASKGFLAGLYGQQKDLEKLMESLGAKLASGISKNFGVKKPKKHASGGIAAAGELALVGEQGPELISVGTTSRVYTAGETARMLGADAGGVHIEGGVHVHISGTWDLTKPDAAKRLAKQAGSAIREEIRKLDRAQR